MPRGPFIPRTAKSRISPLQYGDNGAVASNSHANLISTKINQALRYQRKEVFSHSNDYGNAIVSSASARPRWRFAFHSGVMANRLVIRTVMKPADATTSGPYVLFEVISSTRTSGGSVEIVGGAATSASPVFTEYTYGRATIDIDPDTDYEAVFTDYDGAILFAASVHEEAIPSDETVGYIDTSDVMRPIYSSTRQQMMETMDDLWAKNGSHCFNWTVDSQDSVRFMTNSSTARNIIDDSSTSVTAATPGYKIDLRYKNRRSQTTVPCIFRAFGTVTQRFAAPGSVTLLNSSGTVVATIVIGYVSGDAENNAWWSTSVDLPATEAKYDIFFAGYGSTSPSNRIYIHAVSLYEFDGDPPSAPSAGAIGTATATGGRIELPFFYPGDRRL